jgi:phenylpyruvate tautomerase PptA (4-oxalocrotonate tautomerase family)
MPKIYIKFPQGTFSQEAKNKLAEELTTIALRIENLPNTPFVRSTVWIYMNQYPESDVFHGGKPGGTKVVSVEVNAFKGGLDTPAKKLLIEEFTQNIGYHAGFPTDRLYPVYIVIRDVEETDWGIFGKTITLYDARNPRADAKPI